MCLRPLLIPRSGPRISLRRPGRIADMTQKILDTERLRLVPLAEEHLEFEVELDSDPEVMRCLAGRASSRAEVEQAHQRRLAAAPGVPGLMSLLDLGVISYSTSPCSAPGIGSSYGSLEMKARVKVRPTAFIVARDARLTAMV